MRSGSVAVTVTAGSRANTAPVTRTFGASGIDTDLGKTLAIFLLKPNLLLVGMIAKTPSEVNKDSSLIVLGQVDGRTLHQTDGKSLC